MQLNLTKRLASLRAAACLLALAVAGLTAIDADAHFSFGQYSYKYPDCRIHVDPVTVVFYGSKAFARSVKHNVIRHMDWRNTEGGIQYFATHRKCYGMDFQQAQAGDNSSRFHIRAKQGKDRDHEGRYNTVGTAHHEDWVIRPPCWGKHAIDQNGPEGSGFDQGRRQVARRFAARGHLVKNRVGRYGGNTERFRQCDGGVAQSNGKIAWIQVTHFKH